MQRSLSQRLAGRRRQRGAAMVESLVVIPFFILIFAGTMFVGGFYAKRIHLQNEVRAGAWEMAVSQNCDGVATGNLAAMEIVDSSDLQELSGSPLAALCNKDFGSVNFPAKDSHTMGGPFPFTQNIAALAVVPCNETPVPGDTAYDQAVEFLWAAYQASGTLPPDAQPATTIPLNSLFLYTSTYGGGGGVNQFY
ncbi:MAG: hypothetical protein RIF41_33785 [Polyangiaceae bacterium]